LSERETKQKTQCCLRKKKCYANSGRQGVIMTSSCAAFLDKQEA